MPATATNGHTNGHAPASRLGGQVPPHDQDAERSVLCCMILTPQSIDDIALEVSEADLYVDHHRKAFAALLAMHNAGRQIDAATLGAELQARGQLEDCGGVGGILRLLESAHSAHHWRAYCGIVLEHSYRRQAMECGYQLTRSAYDPTVDQEQLLQSLEVRVTELVERKSRHNVVDLQEALIQAFERLEGGGGQGMSTGFSDLDQLTTGVHGGQLIIVAARPGMGKTAFAASLAHQVSVQVPTLVFSLEMSRLELAERLLSMDAGIGMHTLRSGELTQDQHVQLTQAASLLYDRQIHIDDEADRTVLQVASIARQYRRRKQIGLVIVDYLQLMAPTDRKMPREQQVSEQSRALKCLAKSLNIPVIVLAQLNREIEKRHDKRPLLADLRESGAIEQDADQVWMLYRPCAYMEQADPEYEQARGRAELLVRKNRSGKTGTVHLQFTEQTMRFRNAASQHYSGHDGYPENF